MAKSGTKQVLNDMTFNVRKGEVLGLVGRNGSGKSTLLKLLSNI
ncbi:MAG: ATP-binding cassette domain-containing protein, partial [Candidatus Methanomethylophilaceae archaeon]|nr:ATP-binding cassette domain-containing protein [Candidatus Methanomethylophilaceae archaeon]